MTAIEQAALKLTFLAMEQEKIVLSKTSRTAYMHDRNLKNAKAIAVYFKKTLSELQKYGCALPPKAPN